MSELTTDTNEIITGYKAFNPDFKCRGFQYKAGKTFEHEGESGLCSKGFHFCPKDPLDVFNYYPLVSMESGLPTRLAKVSAPKKDTIVDLNGVKCVTSKISIDKEITLNALIKEQIKKACKSEGEAGLLIAEGEWSTLTDSGLATKIISNKDETHISLTRSHSMAIVSANHAYLASSGDSTGLFAIGGFACLSSSGYGAGIYNSGFLPSTSASGARSTLRITGDQASVASSGAESALYVSSMKASVASSGTYSKLRIISDQTSVASSGENATVYTRGNNTSVSVSGHSTKLTVTGKRTRMAAVGDGNQVIYDGTDGVISVLGMGAEFKGSKGTLVSAVVYNATGKPIDIITGRIGENGLKPDTLYTVSDGKFVEMEAESE